MENAEVEHEDLITLSVSAFVLLLSDTTVTGDVGEMLASQCKHHAEADFVRLSATSLSLDILSHPRRIEEGGQWMLVKGELGELLVSSVLLHFYSHLPHEPITRWYFSRVVF